MGWMRSAVTAMVAARQRSGERIGAHGKALGRGAGRLAAVALTAGLWGPAQGQPYDKWVDAFFNSSDPFIQGTVIPNIEKNRKSNEQLTFTGKDGRPLAGLRVSATQIEHSFLWGCAPPFENSAYNTPAFYKLWRDVYNYGITQYAFKWSANEKQRGVRDFTHADALLEDFRASGAQLELHFLTGYHPDWVDSLPTAAEKANAQHDYALAALAHFQDKIRYYQVYNEDMLTHVPGGKVYSDQTGFFGELSKLYPNLHLGINDCYVWNPASAAERFPTPAALRAKFPGIKFIAMHGHRPHSYWPTPQQMYSLFDPYTGSGVKVQIAEFGVMDQPIQGAHSGPWTDDLRAQYFVSAYATAFSHPAFEAFNQWGIGPDTNRWNGNYMIHPDGTVENSYSSVKSLIRDKFMTKTSGTSDAGGLFKFRGFRGQYRVTVQQDGLIGEAMMTLGDSDGVTSLNVRADGAGKLILQGGSPVSIVPFQSVSRTAAVQAPEIRSGPGQDVLFTGLRRIAGLEILDVGGRRVRRWTVVGDRILWDRTDASGRAVGLGTYWVRSVAQTGTAETRVLRIR